MDTRQMGTQPVPLAGARPVRTPETLEWRVRVAILWIIYAVCVVFAIVFVLIEPGSLKDVMAGKIEGTKITDAFTLMFAAGMTVPLLMAFLTLVLPPTANRWANGVVAAISVVTDIVDLYGHVADGAFAGDALMMVAAIVAELAIVWFAWSAWREVRSAARIRVG
jgi:hypothetical protein